MQIRLVKTANHQGARKRNCLVAFMLLGLLSVTNFLSGQNIHQQISIRGEQTTLTKVLEEISAKTSFHFAYNPARINLHSTLSFAYTQQPLSFILNDLLSRNSISWSCYGYQIILKPTAKRNTGIQGENQRRFTLCGTLRDSLSGEALIGAALYDAVSFSGTTSNAYGFYSLTLPEGNYTLTTSMLGYKVKQIAVRLNGDVSSDIRLSQTGLQVSEVEIISEKESAAITQTTPGEAHLSSKALHSMTGFAGNVDIIKALQSVPGISSFGDGSALYYVRGGNSDQNLLLIDEAPIYNPAHLFGFFSALSPNAIKDVKTYKSGFPASYGGRLSSVIDIRARDGNFRAISFTGNAGIFTSDITLEGPLAKDKSSFIMSARRSNLSWITRQISKSSDLSIAFYDLNLKLNLRLSSKDRLFFTTFTGNDNFSRISSLSASTFGITWNNSTATLRWNHIFSNRLFNNTTFIYSKYNYYLFISREKDDYWHSSIKNRTLKSDFSWFIHPGSTVKWGFDLGLYDSDPGNVHLSDSSSQQNSPFISRYQSLGANLYIGHTRQFGRHFQLNYGLRISAWRNLGPSTVYLFDNNHQPIDTIQIGKGSYYAPYYNAEPRFTVSYTTSSGNAFTIGYARTAQYLQVLSNSTSPFTSLEVWAPSGPTIQPQTADQLSLGFTTNSSGKWVFSAETYLKALWHQIDYTDHANMLFNPLVEGELRFGDTKAWGAELLMQKTTGRFKGWLGMSYTRAIKTIDGVNNGNAFPASFERPLNGFINLSYPISARIEIAASWVYMTGSPVTSPIGFISLNGSTVPLYGEKNNDRLPDYHRLDISATFRLNSPEKKYRHTLIFSVYNAYGRNNPFAQSFNKIMNDNGDFVVPSNLNGDQEIIPTRISVAGVIPSINYTFSF